MEELKTMEELGRMKMVICRSFEFRLRLIGLILISYKI